MMYIVDGSRVSHRDNPRRLGTVEHGVGKYEEDSLISVHWGDGDASPALVSDLVLVGIS
jgi:hypothetical protein